MECTHAWRSRKALALILGTRLDESITTRTRKIDAARCGCQVHAYRSRDPRRDHGGEHVPFSAHVEQLPRAAARGTRPRARTPDFAHQPGSDTRLRFSPAQRLHARGF